MRKLSFFNNVFHFFKLVGGNSNKFISRIIQYYLLNDDILKQKIAFT